ncbi:MAG TPA: protein kinase [Bryobacteraceae bacterium]|jgi:serine/threonine-protein kinase|nr:protein kinase [Bryobacteraceae bacterium]
MQHAPGDKLGPYEIVSLIGTGGMGEVYKAHDARLERDVAIKVSAQQFGIRFEREARAIAALNHSRICQVYDVGPNYLVMEFIEGVPLSGPLPINRAVGQALQICEALEAAHKKDITHRDLKPENILVTDDGIKLLDFGLAKRTVSGRAPASEAVTGDLTVPGLVLGTAAYMSPEQARGEEADGRSDIFSFGLVFYEMLSGKRAFSKKSAIETIAAIMRDEPAPLDSPPAVCAIVNRCLGKAPADRFQTIGEVRAALERLQVTAEHPTVAPPPDAPSIAVLPFANLSPDKENEYFGDGLAEEILNLLSRIPGLKVIARTSAFSIRGRESSLREFAERLNVQTVLEGSVRRAGNRIRVTAQLVNAATGLQLWAERYDRELTHIFDIQDEIGQAIADALKFRLAPGARTPNIEAWQSYLKGVYYQARLTPEGMAKAREFFEHALEVDPNYALPYSGLAGYYYSLAGLGIKPAGDMTPLARSAAEKAIALDPANGQAHSVLGALAASSDYDWGAARSHHRQALAADPVAGSIRHRYAQFYLLPLGRTEDAITQCRLALETDPLSLPLHFCMACCLYTARRYKETIDYARKAIEIDPNFYFMWATMGLAQLHAGLVQDALESLQRAVALAPWFEMGRAYLAAAACEAGDRKAGLDYAQKLAASNRQMTGAALCFGAAGEVDSMFDALHEAWLQRDWNLLFVQSAPFFDPYRADPRYQALLQSMNLPAAAR